MQVTHVSTATKSKAAIMTTIGRTPLERAVTVARNIRRGLLREGSAPRNLAGQCGLAAMLMAAALGDANSLRTGFYMKHERFLGKSGRYPHQHAWCRVGPMIIDATASQFDRSHSAVHVARFNEDTRYIETTSGNDAINDIMNNWRGRELPLYVQLARNLRRILR